MTLLWSPWPKLTQSTAPLHDSASKAGRRRRELYKEFSAEQGWHRIRRTATTRPLEYGKSSGRGHPFERYSSESWSTSSYQLEKGDIPDKKRQRPRHVVAVDDDHLPSVPRSENVPFEDKRYPDVAPLLTSQLSSSSVPSLQTSPSPYPINEYLPLYEPLRIQLDSRRLQPLIESNPKKYASLINHLVTRAMPKAANFWSEHLSTVPVEGSIVVTEEECPLAFLGNDNGAGTHTFYETDLVLYLFLDEGPCLEEDPPIAFSSDCAMDQYDRPTAVSGEFLLHIWNEI